MAVSDLKLPPFKIISAPQPRARLTSSGGGITWTTADPEMRGSPTYLGLSGEVRLEIDTHITGTIGETPGLVFMARWWQVDAHAAMGGASAHMMTQVLRVGPEYFGGWLNVGNGVQLSFELAGVITDTRDAWNWYWHGFRGVPAKWAEVDLSADLQGNPRVIFEAAQKVGQVSRDLGGSLRQVTRYMPVTGKFPRPPIRGAQRGNLNLLAGFRHPVCFMPDYDDSTLLSVIFDRTLQPLVGTGPRFIGDNDAAEMYVRRMRHTRRDWCMPAFHVNPPRDPTGRPGVWPVYRPGLVGYAWPVAPFRVNNFYPSSALDASTTGWTKLGGTGGVHSFIASPDMPEQGGAGFLRVSSEAASGEGLTYSGGVGFINSTWVFSVWLRGSMIGGDVQIRMSTCSGSDSTLTIDGDDLPREWTRYTLHGKPTSTGVQTVEVEKIGGSELTLDVAGAMLAQCYFMGDVGQDWGSPPAMIPTSWGQNNQAQGNGASYYVPMGSDRGTLAAVVTWDGSPRDTQKTTGSLDNVIVGMGSAFNTTDGLSIIQRGTRIEVRNGAGTTLMDSGVITKDHGDWYSVVLTWEPNGGSPIKWTMVLYVDGVAVDTDSNVSAVPLNDSLDGKVGDRLILGAAASGIEWFILEIVIQAVRADGRAWAVADVEAFHNSWFTQAGQEIRRYTNNRHFLTSARFQPADAAGVFLDGPMELSAAGGVGRYRHNFGGVREAHSAKDPDGNNWT